MPRNQSIAVPPRGQFVELTNANITALTFLCEGPSAVRILAQEGATAPEAGDVESTIRFESGFGAQNVELADLFPGVAGANRVFATSDDATRGTRVFVSHA